MDLSKLLGFAAHMKSDVVGYTGTDTIPNCTKLVCWYLYLKPFTITQEQIDFFKVPGVKSNARVTNISAGGTHYSKILYMKGALYAPNQETN